MKRLLLLVLIVSSTAFSQGIEFRKERYAEVLKMAKEQNKLVFIDIYTSWCGPCKMVAPVLEELAKEYDGKIYIYKVDVDKEEELAATFGIRSIPTLLWIPKNGKPTVTQGAMPKTELKKMIDEVLLNAKP